MKIQTRAVVVWSAATALTAQATSLVQLSLARVGVGKADRNTSAQSIISDYFPAHRRASAMSVYSLGSYLGQVISFIVAGYVAQHFGWRMSLHVVGLPGTAVAIVLKLTLQEPSRGFSEPAGYVASAPPAAMIVLKKLYSLPSFHHLSLAAGLHALVGYGLNSYYSAFLMRSHGMSLTETSTALAIITPSGALAGSYLGGKLSDVFAQRNGGAPRYQMGVPAAALLINVPGCSVHSSAMI